MCYFLLSLEHFNVLVLLVDLLLPEYLLEDSYKAI